MSKNAFADPLGGTHEGVVKMIPTPVYPQIVLALNLLCREPPLFHWYIFVPNANQDTAYQVGRILHAVDNGDRTIWAFQTKPFTLVYSKTLVAGLIIGNVHPPDKHVEDLENLLRQIPMAVPPVDLHREPMFTCRVWVREAIRRMNHQGFINCSNADELMSEMETRGKSAVEAIKGGRYTTATLSRARSCRFAY
ncbi:hypothetical protein EIP86_006705 [Pleurotus ostreatoroseus]|nr:hypothetical protein EIP86_006705 [Pleurotus ostreatoroseus]